VDKVELIVMGGTMTARTPEYQQKPPKAKEKPPQGEEASKTDLRKVKKWSLEKESPKKQVFGRSDRRGKDPSRGLGGQLCGGKLFRKATCQEHWMEATLKKCNPNLTPARYHPEGTCRKAREPFARKSTRSVKRLRSLGPLRTGGNVGFDGERDAGRATLAETSPKWLMQRTLSALR
jgi:hypothetical protein